MHDHTNCDHHTPSSYGLAFALGAVLNATYVVAELGVGLTVRSLSLVADAGHNLGDVLGLLMGWLAVTLAARPATLRRTYGYRKSTVLAAVANAFILMGGVGAIAWEAIRRFSEPVQVPGTVVMGVAAAGILVNGGTALMFARGQKEDLNREAAYVHMLVDAAVAGGVVVAGLLMRMTGLSWIDSVCGLLVAAIVALSSWSLLRRSIDLAMDAVPDKIDPSAVKEYLEGLEGISSSHDLHIWAMSTTETALTVHLCAPDGISDAQLHRIGAELSERFGIVHPTIQIEQGTSPDCPLAPDEVV